MLELLIVDDDAMVRESLAMLLRREGFAVSTAASGTEAVDAAGRQVFDIVVTDVRMPGADGFEVVRQVQALQPGTHFVVITGFASEDATLQALRLRVDDYFHKPFDLAVFVERMRAIGRARTRAGASPAEVLRRFVHVLGELWPAWGAHVDAARMRSLAAGREAGLGGADLEAIQLAAMLHDLRNLEFPIAAAAPCELEGTELERVAALVAGAAAETPAGRVLESALSGASPASPEGPEEVPGKAEAGLVISTLGAARCRVDGTPIERAEWESASARSLFFLLLCERGRRVSEDRLFDALWPDADPDRARRSLKTAVYRVRKALRNPTVLVSGERYYHLDLADAKWDVEEMERAARRAAAHESGHDAPAALREWRAAASHYRGAFLEGLEAEWLLPMRDQLALLAVRALTRVASLHLALGDSVAAEAAARRALALDRACEEARVACVRALAAQGRRDEAVRAYHAGVEVLRRDLGLGPGPELLRAYLELTG
jgi:two-component SAPR family response regulator